jgi:hypothetical protein
MDEPQNHAKSKKLGLDNTYCMSHLYEILGINKSIETGNSSVVARGWGEAGVR